MTNNYQEFFKDNPWEGIESGSYPSSARRLFKEDSRFWVSINSDGNYLFFVEELGYFEFNIDNKLDCLDIKLDQVSNKTRLVCTLKESEMFDKFNTIAKDVAAYSTNYQGLNMFRNIILRIYSWSEFLKPSRTGLGFREMIGFWGELFIFYEYFVKAYGFENALKAWVGPENKKQDVTYNDVSFEIKTSVVGDNNNLKISSIEQLQKMTTNLYLISLRINESFELSGLSIQNLVDTCISLIDDNEVLKNKFHHKVYPKFGRANDSELKRKFIDVNLLTYEVSQNFPQIVPDNLPHDNILQVNYTIDGNSLGKFETSKTLKEIIENGTFTSL